MPDYNALFGERAVPTEIRVQFQGPRSRLLVTTILALLKKHGLHYDFMREKATEYVSLEEGELIARVPPEVIDTLLAQLEKS